MTSNKAIRTRDCLQAAAETTGPKLPLHQKLEHDFIYYHMMQIPFVIKAESHHADALQLAQALQELHWEAAKWARLFCSGVSSPTKKKKGKKYAFGRRFNEKPSIIPGCPVLKIIRAQAFAERKK